MPKILVIKNSDNKIDDHISVDTENLGTRVQELYRKLDHTYSIEILDDQNPRTKKFNNS